jgi:AraC family transcriptional regulator
MNYLDMVADAIDYIEENRDRPIQLDELASRYALSKFYFFRIFRAVTNRTLKEYVDERRLAAAAYELQHTDRRILDIALDAGFGSHEVFTRRFKQLFALSPAAYRRAAALPNSNLKHFEKLQVVERPFKNINNDVAVSYRVEERPAVRIHGRQYSFNPYCPRELQQMAASVKIFADTYLAHRPSARLYSVTNRETAEHLHYTVGGELGDDAPQELEAFLIPAARYAVFEYHGVMKELFPTVLNDVCRCIVAADLPIASIGIDCFELYDLGYNPDYFEDQKFHVYFPLGEESGKNRQDHWLHERYHSL